MTREQQQEKIDRLADALARRFEPVVKTALESADQEGVGLATFWAAVMNVSLRMAASSVATAIMISAGAQEQDRNVLERHLRLRDTIAEMLVKAIYTKFDLGDRQSVLRAWADTV